MGKSGVRTAWTIITAFIMLFAVAWPAAAQNLAIPGQDDYGVPSFSGSGLDGTISNSTSGVLATFNAPGICYPDCFQNTFDPTSGTLVDFTSNTITNLIVFGDNPPPSIANTTTTLTGYINIPEPGLFEFSLTGSASATLNLDNQPFLATGGGDTDTAEASFTAAGLYSLAIEYMEDTSQATLDLIVTDLGDMSCVSGCPTDGGAAQDNGALYSQEDLENGAPLPPVGAGLPGLAVLAFAGARALRRRVRR